MSGFGQTSNVCKDRLLEYSRSIIAAYGSSSRIIVPGSRSLSATRHRPFPPISCILAPCNFIVQSSAFLKGSFSTFQSLLLLPAQMLVSSDGLPLSWFDHYILIGCKWTLSRHTSNFHVLKGLGPKGGKGAWCLLAKSLASVLRDMLQERDFIVVHNCTLSTEEARLRCKLLIHSLIIVQCKFFEAL